MIYLDNNTTIKVDTEILEIMLPKLTDNFANASSTHDRNRSILVYSF